ncbi:MAG TPA: hypothetical protein VN328_09085, partial [Thermodesulfovibrionales bacterium]|nr:hypothetical protein [Thermodesulfovibrionales bacterium]
PIKHAPEKMPRIILPVSPISLLSKEYFRKKAMPNMTATIPILPIHFVPIALSSDVLDAGEATFSLFRIVGFGGMGGAGSVFIFWVRG